MRASHWNEAGCQPDRSPPPRPRWDAVRPMAIIESSVRIAAIAAKVGRSRQTVFVAANGPISGVNTMTKQELKEQNEALRTLLMEIREMIDSELEAMDDFETEEEEDEEEEEED